MRVLLVDDSSMMRKVAEVALRPGSLSIALVPEGADVAEDLAAVKKDEEDLILCNINTPVMDGIEFARRPSEVESAKGAQIITITADDSKQELAQVRAAGTRGYIRKRLAADQVREQVFRGLGWKP